MCGGGHGDGTLGGPKRQFLLEHEHSQSKKDKIDFNDMCGVLGGVLKCLSL